MDYLPKASQVSKMIYKMRSGLNNRVKDIHGSISQQDVSAQGEAQQEQGLVENIEDENREQKQKKSSGDSEKVDQTNQILNLGEVIKTIQFKLLKKEIESMIVDRIKTPH